MKTGNRPWTGLGTHTFSNKQTNTSTYLNMHVFGLILPEMMQRVTGPFYFKQDGVLMNKCNFNCCSKAMKMQNVLTVCLPQSGVMQDEILQITITGCLLVTLYSLLTPSCITLWSCRSTWVGICILKVVVFNNLPLMGIDLLSQRAEAWPLSWSMVVFGKAALPPRPLLFFSSCSSSI